jgi:hypothetical protein
MDVTRAKRCAAPLVCYTSLKSGIVLLYISLMDQLLTSGDMWLAHLFCRNYICCLQN